MTHLCEKIISTLPSWRKLNGPNQLMSLQQFVYDVQDQLNPLASEEDLRRIAQQLHSTGEVRAVRGSPCSSSRRGQSRKDSVAPNVSRCMAIARKPR